MYKNLEIDFVSIDEDSLLKEYGRETLFFFLRAKFSSFNIESLILLMDNFKKIRSKNENIKIYYFLVNMYDSCIKNFYNFSLCKNIFSIFKQNIADEDILAEFSFNFEIEVG